MYWSISTDVDLTPVGWSRSCMVLIVCLIFVKFQLYFNCIIVFVYYVYLYLCITYFCVFLCICNCICIFVFVFIFVYLFICICICFCVSFEEVERRDALCISRPIDGQKAGEKTTHSCDISSRDAFVEAPVISSVEAP